MVYLRNAPDRKGGRRKRQLEAKEKENQDQAELENADWVCFFHDSHILWEMIEFHCCLQKCVIFQSALKIGYFSKKKILDNDL